MNQRSQRLLIIFSFLLISGSPIISLAQWDENLSFRVDSLLNRFDGKKPGGALGIYQGGEVLYERYFGLETLSSKKPVTVTTRYNIASMAKQFTALGIAQLEDAGRINREDQIRTYLPELSHFEQVKVKHLLHHTSGLREATEIALLSGKVSLSGELPLSFINEENLIRILGKERDLNFPPGTEHSYTNTNYILLAQIIQRISRQSFGVFLDSAIFKPLGMDNSYIQPSASESVIDGYRNKGKRFKKTKGSGGLPGEDNLITTLDDLRAWYGNYFSNTLNLSASNHQKLIEPEMLENGKSSEYGYGLSIEDHNGMMLAWHDGENNLHTSAALFIPEKELVIICLANATDYVDPTRRVFNVLNMIYPRGKPSLEPVELVEVSTASNGEKEGLYYRISPTNKGSIRKVYMAEGEVYVTGNLEHRGLRFGNIAQDHLYATNTNGNPINLYFENKDSGLILRENYIDHENDWVFTKYDPVKFDPADYKGTYKDPYHGAFFKIKEKKGKLVAKKGLLKVKMMQLKPDTFLGDYDVLFLFERSAANKVSGLLLNIDNLRNFQLEKVR